MHTIPDQHFHNAMDEILADSPYIKGYMFTMDGQNAGYALLGFTFSAEAGGLVILLEEAFVLPEFQGKGFGSELFAFVEKEFGGKARRLRLEVAPSNERAIRLYKRLGFTPLDYLQMHKDLNPS